MTELYPVNSMRGLSLPKDIVPDWMFQVGGLDTLVLQDVKGRIFVRKGTKWYKMTEFKVSELVDEVVTVETSESQNPPEGAQPEITPDPQSGSSAPAAAE